MPPTGQKYLFWYVCIFYNIAKVKKLPCRGGIAKLAFKRAYLARYHTFLFFHCVRVLSPFWYPLYLLLWSIFLVPTILLSLSSDHNKKGENIDNKVFILLIPRPSASSSMPPIATSGVGLTCNMEPSRAWKKKKKMERCLSHSVENYINLDFIHVGCRTEDITSCVFPFGHFHDFLL